MVFHEMLESRLAGDSVEEAVNQGMRLWLKRNKQSLKSMAGGTLKGAFYGGLGGVAAANHPVTQELLRKHGHKAPRFSRSIRSSGIEGQLIAGAAVGGTIAAVKRASWLPWKKNPDKHKRAYGKCPPGWQWDAKDKTCIEISYK
ncbi:MAG: hypothetical protein ACXABY_00870 [Candidatus Thorarchaeota archaeon]|jgi:hypothetical protein